MSRRRGWPWDWARKGGRKIWGPGCAKTGRMELGWRLCRAGAALLARKTRLREAGPKAQRFRMVLVSAPILLAVSSAFGALLREIELIHGLWLLSVCLTPTIASISFLTPWFSIAFGHQISGGALSFGLMGAAGFVAAGIVLINRRWCDFRPQRAVDKFATCRETSDKSRKWASRLVIFNPSSLGAIFMHTESSTDLFTGALWHRLHRRIGQAQNVVHKSKKSVER